MHLFVVGVGWSGYFVKFFDVAFGVHFGENWTEPTVKWEESPPSISYQPGHYFNVPGFVIIMLVTILLVIGYTIFTFSHISHILNNSH